MFAVSGNFSFCVNLTFNADAALYDRGGGLIYDDVLDITWTQNANYVGETMTWNEAMLYVDNFVFGGYDDWRLPTCFAADCAENELSYLYYSYGITSGAPGIFSDVRPYMYWLNEESGVDKAWRFNMSAGTLGTSGKDFGRYGWAVRDGDSPPIVPEPLSSILFMLGAVALEAKLLIKKRKK